MNHETHQPGGSSAAADGFFDKLGVRFGFAVTSTTGSTFLGMVRRNFGLYLIAFRGSWPFQFKRGTAGSLISIAGLSDVLFST